MYVHCACTQHNIVTVPFPMPSDGLINEWFTIHHHSSRAAATVRVTHMCTFTQATYTFHNVRNCSNVRRRFQYTADSSMHMCLGTFPLPQSFQLHHTFCISSHFYVNYIYNILHTFDSHNMTLSSSSSTQRKEQMQSKNLRFYTGVTRKPIYQFPLSVLLVPWISICCSIHRFRFHLMAEDSIFGSADW